MTPEEFRFKDLRQRDENLLRILRGNFALHMRRARDQAYGTAKDRLAEYVSGAKVARQYFLLTGESVT